MEVLVRTISISTHHKGNVSSSNDNIISNSSNNFFAVLFSNTKNIVIFYRCIPRWSLLPGYGIQAAEMIHVAMREFEGTDVTRQNLLERFYDSSWISVPGIEECAR